MSLREIRFYVDLFPQGGSRANSEKRVLTLLEALTLFNQFYLDEHPDTPKLYQLAAEGKIAYKLPGQMGGGGFDGEQFRDIPRILQNGGGDCDNIACFRAAELRHEGIAARPYITHRPRPGGGTIYHVIVLWPDGSSEDPCLLLGSFGHPQNGMAPERTDEIAAEEEKMRQRVTEHVLGELQRRPGDEQADRNALINVMNWFRRAL